MDLSHLKFRNCVVSDVAAIEPANRNKTNVD